MTPIHNMYDSIIPLQFQPLPKYQLSKTQETTYVDTLSTMSDTEMDLSVQGSWDNSTSKDNRWFLFIS